jgi:hypothetical protein
VSAGTPGAAFSEGGREENGRGGRPACFHNALGRLGPCRTGQEKPRDAGLSLRAQWGTRTPDPLLTIVVRLPDSVIRTVMAVDHTVRSRSRRRLADATGAACARARYLPGTPGHPARDASSRPFLGFTSAAVQRRALRPLRGLPSRNRFL